MHFDIFSEGTKVVIGPFINAAAVLIGGALGAIISQRLPERIRVSMTLNIWSGLTGDWYFISGQMRQFTCNGTGNADWCTDR